MDEMKSFAAEFDPRALSKIMAQGGGGEKKLERHMPERRKRQRQEQEQLTSTLVEQQDIEDHDLRLPRVDRPPLPVCAGDYKYTALAPNSRQIRVLYIHDKDRSTADSLLSCTVEIVDLDDKTDAWASFTSTKDADPQCLLAQWFFLNVHKEELLKEPETFWLKPSSTRRPAPERPRPAEKVQSRYTWGDFITLSYVWGNPCSRRDILLNGHVFSTTSNLYDALVHLRDSFEVRQLGLRLWADAICINQQDVMERATEVKKMGLVYSQCLSVRAWIGQPDAACIQHMQTLQHYLDEAGDACGPLEVYWETVEDFGVEEAAWVIGSALAFLPYWERMWIIQEMVLAPTILLSFGASVFTTRQILLVLVILSIQVSAGKSPLQFEGDIETIIQKVGHRLTCLRPEGPSGYFLSPKVSPTVDLAHVLGMAQISKATDPRDKVFGLLALLPPTVMDAIQPDYRASFSSQDAIIMFSKAYLEFEGRLDSLVRLARLTEMPSDLPTWVFDLYWISHCDHHQLTKRPRGFRTQHENLNLAATTLTFGDKDTTMLCQGIIMDAINPPDASPVPSAEPSLAEGTLSPHNLNIFYREREADSSLHDAAYLR
ncbi:heterokaryon incompatibility protein-domain-containing protein [Xylaria digitata]|nr:heterokaryon incompatibility protein-domain-containing protein [Xylaria digitata]